MVMLVGTPDLVSAYAVVKGVRLKDPCHVAVPEAPAVAKEIDGRGSSFELDADTIRRLATKGCELAIRLMPTVSRLALEQGGQLSLF